MSSEDYHEPIELLSEATKNLHRAIVSLVEELQAVDWYNQRAEVCDDGELKAVLEHHRDEEIEHAMMNLEWIRRRSPAFDRNIRLYIFADGDITKIEAAKKAVAQAADGGRAGSSLNLGSLRQKRQEKG